MARAPDLHSGGQGFDSLILHPNAPHPTSPKGGAIDTGGKEERLKKVERSSKEEMMKDLGLKINDKRLENLEFEV